MQKSNSSSLKNNQIQTISYKNQMVVAAILFELEIRITRTSTGANPIVLWGTNVKYWFLWRNF
jgi:hypothetical protein